jgi:hypothetical protein
MLVHKFYKGQRLTNPMTDSVNWPYSFLIISRRWQPPSYLTIYLQINDAVKMLVIDYQYHTRDRLCCLSESLLQFSSMVRSNVLYLCYSA